jgi:mRNA interferase MazF
MVLIAPLTTFRGQAWQVASPALYPVLPAGTAGIAVDSIVLLDQTQAVDASRIGSLVGKMSTADYAPIEAGLRLLCDL